jgi:hypothetical protein
MSDDKDPPSGNQTKKLYHVCGTLDIDMVVLAINEGQAREIGKSSWSEEMRNAGLAPEAFSVSQVRSKGQLGWLPDEYIDAITPYGPDEEDSPQLTILEYLNQMGIE